MAVLIMASVTKERGFGRVYIWRSLDVDGASRLAVGTRGLGNTHTKT